jgi:hypothetical protein
LLVELTAFGEPPEPEVPEPFTKEIDDAATAVTTYGVVLSTEASIPDTLIF